MGFGLLAADSPCAAPLSAFYSQVGFMAVYTEVSFDEASALFERLGLERLTTLEGCSGGIENTN